MSHFQRQGDAHTQRQGETERASKRALPARCTLLHVSQHPFPPEAQAFTFKGYHVVPLSCNVDSEPADVGADVLEAAMEGVPVCMLEQGTMHVYACMQFLPR